MYSDNDINGASLPAKTLCLTFDDGPGETTGPGTGPQTLALAQYLNAQGVPATFFMVGKLASDLPHILPEVESLGHLIGNHTYDHPNLVDYVAAGGDVVSQVARADGLIRNWIDSPVVFVRAPYGNWSADVARSLNSNLTVSLSHVGPIRWDMDGGDWGFWRDHGDPQACLLSYLAEVDSHDHGIILMHDCTADMEVVKRGNRALEFVQLLIPALVQRGYQFARLDEIPYVAARIQNTIHLALKGSNGLYVSPQGGGGGSIIVNGPAVGAWEPLIVEDLYVGKVALRTVNGQYISPDGGGSGAVFANGPTVGDWEPFDLISLGANQVAFRTATGHFLTCDTSAGGILTAAVWLNIQEANVFTYEYLP